MMLNTHTDFPAFPRPKDVLKKLTLDQLTDEYQGGLVYQQGNAYKVYADKDLLPAFGDPIKLDEVVITGYSNAKRATFDNLIIRVFVSKDGVKLLKQYKNVIVYENQLALFIELDDDYNINGSVLRVKAGNGIEKIKDFPMKKIIDFAKKQAVDVDVSMLKKFLKEAHRSKKGVFYWFLEVVSKAVKALESIPIFLTQTLTEILGTFFFETIPNILDSVRLEEKHWNPAVENYKPFFIPNLVIKQIENAKHSEKVYDTVINDFFAPIHTVQDNIIKGSIVLGTFAQMPKNQVFIIKDIYDYFFEQIFAIEKFFRQNKNNFWDLLLSGIEAVNAFFVGLYNSIIDTIKGIFQLIGLVFKAISGLMEAASDLPYYTELAGEMLENLREEILKLKFNQIYEEFVKFGVNIYHKIVNSVSEFSFSLQEIAYFIGYLLGFVVETIISLLFTGGTLTVEEVLSETFIAPLQALLKGVRKMLSKAKNLFEKIYIFVKKLLSKLKNPKQALQELFEAIMKLFKTGDEFVTKVEQYVKDWNDGKIKLNEKIDKNGKVVKRKPGDYARASNLGEMVADVKWMKIKKWYNGKKVDFVPLHKLLTDIDAPGSKGIDSIFENLLFKSPPMPPPPKYIINETKTVTTSAIPTTQAWLARLKKTKSLGKQMSSKWIKGNLKKITNDIDLIEDILKNHETFLTGVSKKGTKVDIFQLTNEAKTIKKIEL